MHDGIFYISIFVVATLYASVGHGGASGYLALMALFGAEVVFMKSSALLLNIFVSGIAFISLFKGGHFKWKLAWPFCITSVPMAFIGSGIILSPEIYKNILGIFLIFAVIRILLSKKNFEVTKNSNLSVSLLTGAIIGFFSGLIGIGGGIVLSPFVLLLKWGNIKETAAVSAFFILVNSLSGLTGMYTHFPTIEQNLIYMVLFAISGGIAGSWYTNKKATPLVLKYILSVVLLFAALKLIIII